MFSFICVGEGLRLSYLFLQLAGGLAAEVRFTVY